MPEQLSLFAKFQISHKNYERYLESAVEPVNYYTDWIPWLEARQMYGGISEQTLESISYQHPGIRSFLIHWLNDDYPFPGNGLLKYENGTLLISVIYFSENYREYIYHLHTLRSIGNYMSEAEQGFILIYDHFWGSEDVIGMEITAGHNSFLDDVPEGWVKIAQEHIEERVGELEKNEWD